MQDCDAPLKKMWKTYFQFLFQNSEHVLELKRGLFMKGSISYPVKRVETKFPPLPLVDNVDSNRTTKNRLVEIRIADRPGDLQGVCQFTYTEKMHCLGGSSD